MATRAEQALSGRERGRLRRARENGYLDARCAGHHRVVRAHGLWCWRLKIPMVWMERTAPYSRYGRVRLDMLTTPNVLTAAGQAALRALGADARISAHDACWERVPLSRLEALGKAALRAAIVVGNYKVNKTPAAKVDFSRLARTGS